MTSTAVCCGLISCAAIKDSHAVLIELSMFLHARLLSLTEKEMSGNCGNYTPWVIHTYKLLIQINQTLITESHYNAVMEVTIKGTESMFSSRGNVVWLAL